MRSLCTNPVRSGRLAVLAALLAGVATPGLAQNTAAPVDTDPGAAQQLPEAEAGDVIVTGSRASREQAIERKRALPVIADVVASDDIGKLPDFNTAEAVQRLPGVSVEIDQGEPRYVVVRGIDPNLNQVTVDGNIVGIPEAEGRRVALDTIPSDLVAAIEVVKAVTPDYDANAIGGSINLVTPTAFDRADPFTFATVRGAYNDKSGKTGFGGSATHGRRFGPDQQFGIVVAGSYLKRFIDSDLAEPTGYTAFGPAGAQVFAPLQYLLYDYRIMRERIGAIVNLDWRPSDAARFYVRSIYNEFTDEEERDQYNFAFAAGTPTFPTATSIRFPNGRATRQFRQNNQTQKLFNLSPGAELRFGAAELGVNYTYARAQEKTPIRDDLEFRSATGKVSVLELTPGLPQFSFQDPSLFDPSAFPLRRIRERRESIVEDLHTIRADLKVAFGDSGEHFVKVGGKFISRDKDRDSTQVQRLAIGTSTLTQTGGTLPTPDDFYNGRFAFGPAIDYAKVLAFYAANPALTSVDVVQTAVNERALDYVIREKIYAGYAMGSVKLGDLTAIGGVRVERTQGRYDAFAIRGGGTNIQPLSFEQNYTHVLPSVHLNYRPSTRFTLRAAWTNTIGRPNYDAQVPTFTEDSGVGSAGNPDLEPYTAMGLDLSAEYYPDTDSIFSLGVFYKQVKNPIFTRTLQNTSFAGVTLTSLSQPQNADRGKLFGVEANLQRRFTFLPAPFDGFGASVNGTYVTSDVTVPGRESEDIPFFSQSDKIANAALFYERRAFEARLALNYRSEAIVNVGTTINTDIYQSPRTTLDARLSYKINDAIEVFGSLSNLTNAPLTYYQRVPTQTYSRQIYSVNGDFGLSLRF
ncbi:TonB-dependent receptor [Sphingomonas sp.]|jgi:TonB-dependent receptor|uniref:TonB-dependent receptor n=1 Tax=Sphingomonas sp. TaxID=28214 RepID=UPI002D8079F7|nr:TonB-dependent receptor [Sphingomonas sp.]HEU0043503.1 TonB-dependent receptor [Sphingomonas sp.]